MELIVNDNKICKICEEAKSIDQFRKNGTTHRATCRSCEKQIRIDNKTKAKNTTERQMPGINKINNKIKDLHKIFLEANRNYQNALTERKNLISAYDFQDHPMIVTAAPTPPTLAPDVQTTFDSKTDDEMGEWVLDWTIKNPDIKLPMGLENARSILEKQNARQEKGRLEYERFFNSIKNGVAVEDLVSHEDDDD